MLWHAISLTSSVRCADSVRRLAPVDAQTYWMSAKIPNDAFLLYGFAGVPSDLDQAIERIRGRANDCPELRLRVHDGNPLTYPAWVRGNVDSAQFVVHDLTDASWAGCLAAVSALADEQLDPRVMAWRLHVFTRVEGPANAGPATVAVLQVAHVLGDGVRSSALAAHLFGRAGDIPCGSPPRLRGVNLPWRSVAAALAHRRLIRDTAAGRVNGRPPSTRTREATRSGRREASITAAKAPIE